MARHKPVTLNPVKIAISAKRDNLRITKARQMTAVARTSKAFKKLSQAQRDMLTYMFVDNIDEVNAYRMSHNQEKAPIKKAAAELDKPAVQAAVSDILDNVGLDTRTLALAVKDGIEATHVTRDPSTGERYSTDLPDHGTRFQYVKLAFELRGEKPSAGQSHITNNTVHVTLEGDDEIEDDFKKVLEKKYNNKDTTDIPRPEPIDAEYE